jgi:Tol biopolymer transport system component
VGPRRLEGSRAPRAIEIDDALRIARQIAAGLEVAHEKGIVHRDLKPANVKVTPEGQVKILDFGLAKAMAGDAASSELANSPTLTARATEAGMILGTAAYMSPEQARGKAVDKRADIWAFGAVLFEMLTGRRAFDGDTVSDVLASVLKTEPDWNALPAATPPHVTALLRRCLERDLSRRLRDIGEARFAFDTGLAPAGASVMTSGIVAGTPAPVPRSRPWMWIAASAMFAIIALYFGARATIGNRPVAAPAGSFDLALAPPDGAEFQIGVNSGNVIVSPDGTKIAFVAATPKATTLWVRSLTADDAHAIAGTDGAFYPFWSPDGRRIAFFAGSKLKTVDLAGGLPEAIADAPVGRGGSWGEDGTIIFTASGARPVSRVASTGGPVTTLTTIDAARQENAHYFPTFLPGGSQFLYFARSAQPENSGIYLARLDGSTPPVKLVASLGSGLPVIRPSTGELYLVWARESDLLAERLDAAAGALRGDAVTIAHGVRVDDSQRLTFAGASRTGVLAWATQHAADIVLGVYNRAGRRVQQIDVRPLQPNQPALSPDGRMVAFMSADKGGSDIYMRDLQTGDTQRVSTEVPYDEEPSWTPDGRSILHMSFRPDARAMLRRPLNALSQPVEVHLGQFWSPAYETPDGRFIVTTLQNPKTGLDVIALPKEGPAVPLLVGPANEGVIAMSTDGRWIVTTSDEGGRPSTSVVRLITTGPTPSLGARLVVDGDRFAVGVRGDGKEIYAVTPAGLVSAIPLVPNGEAATLGAGTTLFQAPGAANAITINADGTVFVVVETPFATGQTLRVLTNWETRLK